MKMRIGQHRSSGMRWRVHGCLLMCLLAGMGPTASAQRAKLDSLLHLLNNHPARDSRRVDLMNKVVRTYYWIDPRKGEKAGREAVVLARQVGDPSLLGTAISTMVGARQCYLKDDQRPLLNEAIALLKEHGPAAEYGYALYRKANILSILGLEPDTMQALYEEAYRLFQREGDGVGQSWILLNRAAPLYLPDSIVKWRQLVNGSLRLASTGGASETPTMLWLLASDSYYSGDIALAHERFQRVIDLTVREGTTMDEATIRAGYGGMLQELGLNEAAIDQYLKAQRLHERMEAMEGVATTSNAIGCLLRSMGDHAQAKPYLERSLAIAERDGPDHLVINNLGELGTIALERGERAKALEIFRKALKITQAMGNKWGAFTFYFSNWDAHNNLGRWYANEAEPHRALTYFHTADTSALAGTFFPQSLITRAHMAPLLLKLVPPLTDSARHMLTNALADAQAQSLPAQQRDLLEQLALLEETIGNIPAALRHWKRYVAVKDSLLNEEKVRSVNDLKLRYETEKKDLAIDALEQQRALQAKEVRQEKRVKWLSVAALLLSLSAAFSFLVLLRTSKRNARLLAEKNAAILSTQTRLVESERQREASEVRTRIARDVHDQLGSDLTKLVMLSSEVRALLKEDPSSIVRTAEDIERIAGEANRSLGDIVWAIDPHHDSLAGLTERVRAHCERMLKWSKVEHTVDCAHEGPDRSLDPATKRDIYLMLREALNNAIKYAQARHINVVFHTSGSEVRFAVVDDGVGMDVAGNSNGHGLANLRQRAERCPGQLIVESAPQRGTRITFTAVLPVPEHV